MSARPSICVGGQFPGGDAHPQHDRFLRRADVEHAVVAEVKRVLLVGQLVVLGVGQEAVPDVEAVLLQLPEFGFGKLGNRRAEDVGLGGFGGRGGVGQPGGGFARDRAVRRVADEGHEAALHHPGHETGEVFLLRGAEGAGRGQERAVGRRLDAHGRVGVKFSTRRAGSVCLFSWRRRIPSRRPRCGPRLRG